MFRCRSHEVLWKTILGPFTLCISPMYFRSLAMYACHSLNLSGARLMIDQLHSNWQALLPQGLHFFDTFFLSHYLDVKGFLKFVIFFARDRCFLRIAFPFEFLIVSPDCFVFCLFPVWTLLFVVAGIQLKAVALLSSFASSRFKAIVTPGGSPTSRL